MKRIAQGVGSALAASGLIALTAVGPAHADSGTVHFAAGSASCSITGSGVVGCDMAAPYTYAPFNLPLPLKITDIVIDSAALPAHPVFTAGAHTLPGGNPPMAAVQTRPGVWGPIIEYAGASCESGFHGSFRCSSKGHSFDFQMGMVSAS